MALSAKFLQKDCSEDFFMLQVCKPLAYTGQSSRMVNDRISSHLSNCDLIWQVNRVYQRIVRQDFLSEFSEAVKANMSKSGLAGVTKLDFPKGFSQNSSPKKT